MNVQIYIHTHIHMHICMYMYIHTCTYIQHTYIHTYIRAFMNTYVRPYVHTDIYIYICVCVCVCIYIYPVCRSGGLIFQADTAFQSLQSHLVNDFVRAPQKKRKKIPGKLRAPVAITIAFESPEAITEGPCNPNPKP